MIRLCSTYLILIMSLVEIGNLSASNKYAIEIEDAIFVVDTVGAVVRRVEVGDIYDIGGVTFSPSGNYIAWQEYLYDISECKCNVPLVGPPFVIVVMNLNKGFTDTLCNALQYSWTPGRDKFAYIEYLEDYSEISGHNYKRGHTVWQYDPATGEEIELENIDCDDYTELYWSEFENKLSISCLTGPDRHYDPKTGTISEFWGYRLKISPDGKYGFQDTIDDEADLYDLGSQKKIQLVKSADSKSNSDEIYASLVEWGRIDGRTVAYVYTLTLEYIDCTTGRMYPVIPPSPDVNPIYDLVGFRNGRPVWAKIDGDRAELFYYDPD